MRYPRYARFQFILWALTPEDRERYAEEWAAIMLTDGLDPKTRWKLWRGLLSFGFQLAIGRVRPVWNLYASVALIALVIAPFWLVLLFPAFLSHRKAVD